MDDELTARVCFIALQAKKLGYSDVAAWMQKHLSEHVRQTRGSRRRGLKVKLLGGRANAVLDEARVRELGTSR